MKVALSAGRVSYEPKFAYQDGVLIGSNWFEERLHYVKEKHNHISTYKQDFIPQKPNAVHPDIVWNNKIKGEGINRSILMDHEGDKYHENFSSLVDLSYKWLPKCPKPNRVYNAVRQTYIPEQDFAMNYGNVTNFGLRKQRKIVWDYENLTGTTSWTTESRDNYLKPEPQAYYTKSQGIPKALSSKIFPVNSTFNDLPLRGQAVALVPGFPLLVQKRPYPHFYF